MSARIAAIAALLATALPAGAAAQSFQCAMPPAVAPLAMATPDGPARKVPVTGYTLALSWSPEFCRARQSEPAHRLQCSGTAGRFGFIVHGLWPEGARSWPQWCRSVAPPPPNVVRGQLCRTPSPELIGHEWAKHGSCMSPDAKAYFRIGNILADSIRYPDMERLSRDPQLTAGTLRQALAVANPGRPAASFGVHAGRTGWLREVRVCHNRRFRPSRCPSRLTGVPDSAPLKIWRGLRHGSQPNRSAAPGSR